MGIFLKIFLLICIFACVSLLMLHTIYPQLFATQLISFAIGIAVFFIVQKIPFRLWKLLAPYLFVLIVGALVATYVLGKTSKGSTRWISLGISQVQPSQFAKPLLALFLAVLVYRKTKISVARKTAMLLGVAAIPTFLVFFQPDLGTSLVMIATTIVALIVWGMPVRFFLFFACVAVVVSMVAWTLLLKPYQKDRMYALLNPTNNLSTSGYNALQSQIAVGSGKLFGRGLGRGVESELRFLPERHTDFFFASFSEELGFVGDVLLLSLYGAFFLMLDRYIASIRNPEGKLYSSVILGMLCVQFGINVAMNMGLLPITGIPLPLLSYGGSSIVAICFALGLVVSSAGASGSRPQVEIHTFL